MYRTRAVPSAFLASASLLILLLAAGPAPADTPAPAGAPEDPAGVPAPGDALYGPILARDPDVRAQIKHLYLEQRTIETETLARLAELNRAYAAETDVDFRWEYSNEMGELKRTLEIRSIEIGLEIAQLNGQGDRAAEFAFALDQILHPEVHFPAHRPDPALKAARLREHGQ